MKMQSFLKATYWVRVTPRARSAVLLLIIANATVYWPLATLLFHFNILRKVL